MDHRKGPKMAECTHLDQITISELPESVEGCDDCLREGTKWLHLRLCLECGFVGCCDNSPQMHMTGHNASTDHALIRSLEPGEEWSYCYPDDLAMVITEITGQTRIPPSPLM